MAGFGRSKFGKGPFGKSDTGRDLIIELFPSEYLEPGTPEGLDLKNNNVNPLLKVLKTFANSVAKRRQEVDTLPNLIDYEKAPSDILLLIGEMLGLGIDKNDPLFLQRSFVGNASQWLQIKSSKKGYSVRALASGFTVTVQNYWRVDPSYMLLFPARNRYFFSPVNKDPGVSKIFHTDLEPGTIIGTPSEEGSDYAKSSYIKVIFEIAEPRRSGFDYNTLLDLVIDKITDVVAIHHEISAPEFRITVNVSVPTSSDIIIHENIDDYRFNEFARFDNIPSDVQPCDYDDPIVIMIGGPEQNTVNLTVGLNSNYRLSEEVDHSIPVPITLSLTYGQEIEMAANVGHHYDNEIGDEVITDGPIGLDMSIQITET